MHLSTRQRIVIYAVFLGKIRRNAQFEYVHTDIEGTVFSQTVYALEEFGIVMLNRDGSVILSDYGYARYQKMKSKATLTARHDALVANSK